MSEHFAEGGRHVEKRAEDATYRELENAMTDERRLLDEMEQLLATSFDRVGAEREILQRHAPLLEQAMKRVESAASAWLEAMRTTVEQSTRE
jgi:ElaB/YqjD/DUF883 family membrane-anchored ribosome-binding protein